MSRRPGQKPSLRTNHVSTYGKTNAQKLMQPNATLARAVLPPSQEAIRRAVEAFMCPWCGRGPFKIITLHTTRVHGVDRYELRDLAGLLYSDSLSAPEVTAQRRSAPQNQNPEHLLRTTTAGQPRKLSRAAVELNRAKLESAKSPERARLAGVGSASPEARAKRSATLRAMHGEPEHGSMRMYRGRGCRCSACREANAAAQRILRERRRTTGT